MLLANLFCKMISANYPPFKDRLTPTVVLNWPLIQHTLSIIDYSGKHNYRLVYLRFLNTLNLIPTDIVIYTNRSKSENITVGSK